MGDFISREALLIEAEKVPLRDRNYRKYGDIARAIPTADVAEVRHGRWIEQPPDFDLCGVVYYQCSECGREQQTPSNYCQFCGAKMDGGQDDG